MTNKKREPEVVSDEMLDQIQGGTDTNHQGWSDIASFSSNLPAREAAQRSIGAMRTRTIGAAKASVAGSGG